MELKIKDFLTRSDLEAYISAEIGQDSSKNKEAGHLIVGTRKELEQFGLSDMTTIFGIRCKITDFPTSILISQRKKK